MSVVEELARSYVAEYLERDPEYIDVAEHVGGNLADVSELTDELIKKVYRQVMIELDTIVQRWDDE